MSVQNNSRALKQLQCFDVVKEMGKHMEAGGAKTLSAIIFYLKHYLITMKWYIKANVQRDVPLHLLVPCIHHLRMVNYGNWFHVRSFM